VDAKADSTDSLEEKERDEEEAIIEDVPADEEKAAPTKMKTIDVEEWLQLNPHPPLWSRYAPFCVIEQH